MNLAEEDPTGTDTVAGMVIALELEVSLTTIAPLLVPAGAPRVTVPDAGVPPNTELGLIVIELTVYGPTFKMAFCETPLYVAVITTC